MCIPAMAAIGGIVGAAGSIFSGMAASAQYKGQAAAYKAESLAKQYQAQSQANAGAYESSIKLDEGKRLLGKQVTGFASSGVDVSSGSPGEVIADSNSAVNMDVAAIRANWQDRANMSIYESKIAQMNAKNAKNNASMAMTGGIIGAMSPLVNSFSSTKTSFG
jgi:hypothetical protein